MKTRYRKSQELLRRALEVIPLGTQTFSKSYQQYPAGAAPLFLERGTGSHVWDVDGNEYVDFVGALLPVVLGYNDPDVNRAVIEQLSKGVSFSLATPLEIELAEVLREIIPCAEMVRFGKNGSDATSAAVRIARAATARDHVAVCGYHGWQDWYIGATTRNKGVPRAVRELTHKFPYNDLDALERLLDNQPGGFAAVMMEPMNTEEPGPGYLAGVRDLAHRHGALFIFDEIVTGFRYHIGGAQALFGVVPDLAAFGKSMGNGFPISAVVGKTEYMREMEEIFYSSTFGGEAVSLAAALATIRKMRKEPVLERIHDLGSRLIASTRALIAKHGLDRIIAIVGRPCRAVVQFRDAGSASAAEIKTLYLRKLIEHGILSAGGLNLCYSHSDEDLRLLARAQDASFARLRRALDENNVRSQLEGPPIEPVFRVR